MRVTNTNKLAYSLLKADGEYAVLEAGKTADNLDIHPSKIDEYKSKGFVIEDVQEKVDGKQDKTADDKKEPNPAPEASKSVTPDPLPKKK